MSLNGSGQRKPDEVSFLGEISDEDSSDSDSEFEKAEEDDLIVRKNSQGSAAGGHDAQNLENENSGTEKKSSELRDSSNATGSSSNVLKDTPGPCEQSTSSTDLSAANTNNENKKADKESSWLKDSLDAIGCSTGVVKDTPDTCESVVMEKSEGNNELQDSSQLPSNSVDADKNTSVACEASSSNTDVSAVIDNSEGRNEVQDSSQLSSNSVSAVKDTSDVDESPARDTDLSAMMEKSEAKMSKEDSNRGGDEEGCVKENVREFVEGSLGGGESKDKGINVGETKMECPSEKEEMKETAEETKKENLSEANEKELRNIEPPVGENDQRNTESVLSVEKYNSELQPKEEELPKTQQEQENEKIYSSSQDEIEKQQKNEPENQQRDEESKEQTKEEAHEQNSKDTELNNGQDNENKSASSTQGSADEGKPQTAAETYNQGESLQQNAQDSEN